MVNPWQSRTLVLTVRYGSFEEGDINVCATLYETGVVDQEGCLGIRTNLADDLSASAKSVLLQILEAESSRYPRLL